MKYFKKLMGERVYLSPMNPEDAPLYVKWLNDTSLGIYFGQAGRVIGMQGEREFLEKMAADKDSINLAIIKSEGDKLMGNVSLMHLDQVNGTAELGIFIGETVNHSKGYGTEAMNLICEFGFRILNLKNIMLRAFSFNYRALTAYEKVGFSQFGKRSGSFYLDGKYHDEIYMEIVPDALDSHYLDNALDSCHISKELFN